MIRLIQSCADAHIKCPSCKTPLDVDDWGTEYNDPSMGCHYVTCPVCDVDFFIEVRFSILAYGAACVDKPGPAK
jgi:hypothetical protein